MELKPGEKYLTIQVFGNELLRFAVFPNKNPKKTEKSPQFTGNGIAVWVNEKKAATTHKPESVL